MHNPNQSFRFTQGGQTQIHKLRMFKQVFITTSSISLVVGCVVFIAYYFYKNNSLDIMMHPFWVLGEIMEASKAVFKHLKGFTFYIDPKTGHIIKCSSLSFLHSSWIYKFIENLNTHLLQGAIYAFYTMFATFVVASIYFIKKGNLLKQNKHISGLSIVDSNHYKKILTQQSIKTNLTVDHIPIPYDAEVKHFMISGTTGSGKSNMMNHLLKAIESRGDKAIIVDTTGGFVEKFYDNTRDVFLNPFDERTVNWCLWDEPLNHSYECEDMAESLIPQNHHGDPFWINAARQMVSEVLKYGSRHSLTLSDALEILLTKEPRLS